MSGDDQDDALEKDLKTKRREPKQYRRSPDSIDRKRKVSLAEDSRGGRPAGNSGNHIAAATAVEKNPLDAGDRLPKRPGRIVGVGASAGGLAALQSFLSQIPPNTGVAFVVVQHLAPNFKTLMPELLARHSVLTIKLAEDGEKPEPDTVYVMPPNRNIVMSEGSFRLEAIESFSRPNLPVDKFFGSLALEMNDKSVGIILSGTGSDGSIGIKALRDVGGLVIVQEPSEAEFDGMPAAAIRTGYVDSVAAVEVLATQLLAYISNPQEQDRNYRFREHLSSNREIIDVILKQLNSATGVDFSLYKQAMVERRFEHRMGICNLNTLPEYEQLIESNREELELLKADLLIGVTKFFRDQESWQALYDQAFPGIIDSRDDQSPIRVWMIGVSSGEEVYSMAMMFDEYMRENSRSLPIKIYATDVHSGAIEFASSAIYPPHICRDISEERLQRYFTRDKSGNYVIARELRNTVVFATHNVLEDPPFPNIDLVVCRNMLIYLRSEAQDRTLNLFNFSLLKNGYLWLGSSESLSHGDKCFSEIDKVAKIFRKVSTAKALVPKHVSTEKLRVRGASVGLHSGRPPGTHLERLERATPSVAALDIRSPVLKVFEPDAVLLDEELEIKQIFGNCSEYMGFYTAGQISTHIDSLLSPALVVPVATCIARVDEPGSDGSFCLTAVPFYKVASVQSESELELPDDAVPAMFVDVEVRKLDSLTDAVETHYLILFKNSNEVEKFPDGAMHTRGESRERYVADIHTRERVRALDTELRESRLELRKAYAELDTTSEELQSTNEELMAANEELQSTNEELQSVNEELYSVNTEYKEKISELMELNTDLDNLLNSTGYGIIFLDSTLAIRRYTPKIAKYINLLPGDIERLITDFKFDIGYEDLVADLNSVLTTGEVIVKKQRTLQSNLTVTVRINPYISSDKSVDGVVLTVQEPEISITR